MYFSFWKIVLFVLPIISSEDFYVSVIGRIRGIYGMSCVAYKHIEHIFLRYALAEQESVFAMGVVCYVVNQLSQQERQYSMYRVVVAYLSFYGFLY